MCVLCAWVLLKLITTKVARKKSEKKGNCTININVSLSVSLIRREYCVEFLFLSFHTCALLSFLSFFLSFFTESENHLQNCWLLHKRISINKIIYCICIYDIYIYIFGWLGKSFEGQYIDFITLLCNQDIWIVTYEKLSVTKWQIVLLQVKPIIVYYQMLFLNQKINWLNFMYKYKFTYKHFDPFEASIFGISWCKQEVSCC